MSQEGKLILETKVELHLSAELEFDYTSGNFRSPFMDIAGKKIVVTCGGGVGDLVMYTPALRKLKREYNCQLVLLTPRNKEVLDGLPYIDGIIYMQRGTLFGKFLNLHKLKGTYALIMTDWQPNILMAAKYYNIPIIAGYPRKNHILSWIFTKEITTKWHKTLDFVAETHAKVFSEALNIDLQLTESELRCDVAMPGEKEKSSVDAMLTDIGISCQREFIILAPFSGFKLKDWRIEESKKFVELFSSFFGVPVLLLGTADKKSIAKDISPYSLVGNTTILELVEIISRAKLVVTADSGQMHIAGALNVPVVPFFGKEIPARWAPRNNCWPVFLNYPCSPCKDSVALACEKGVACLYEITAKIVFDKVREVLQNNHILDQNS